MYLTRLQSRILAVSLIVVFFVGVIVLLNTGGRTPPQNTADTGDSANRASLEIATPSDEANTNTDSAAPSSGEDDLSKVDEDGSKVFLEKFHRSEMKDGKVVWEVVGTNARFFPKDNTVRIQDGELTFQTKGDEQVEIKAGEALLYLEGGALLRADTSSGVNVLYDQDVTAVTDTATYFVRERRIEAEGPVTINSETIEITGVGLHADLETKVVKLLSNVESLIKPKEKRPK